MKAIIVDLDGTLVDNAVRVKNAGTYNNWDEWVRSTEGDPASRWCLEMIRSMHQQGVTILIITARSESNVAWSITTSWLNKYLPNIDYVLYMNEKHLSAPLFKESVYLREIKGRYDVLFAVDDDPFVSQMWQRNNVQHLYCGTMITPDVSS